MNAHDVLDQLRAHGIGLRLEDSRVLVRDPSGALTPGLRALARDHRDGLVHLLNRMPMGCASCGRFAFIEPTVCFWCRRSEQAKAA